MYFNKNSVTYTLLVIIIFLLSYIFFFIEDVKTVTKIEYIPEVKTVIEEKIVYIDKECKGKKEIRKGEKVQIAVEKPQEKIKKFTIASTSDASYRFKISLFSYEKPSLIKEYKKVILNGKIHNGDSQNIFIMDVNLAILENLNDVYFKVKDTQTGRIYIAQETCLYNLLENFIYKVDLEILNDEVTCTIEEDRIFEGNNQKIPIHTKIGNNTKHTFLKMDLKKIEKSVE